jgi:hypothetical protein
MLMIADGLRSAEQGTLQSCPCARELLLSPDLVSCLAVMVIASMLGWVTSSIDCPRAVATPTASSSSGPVAASSTGLPLASTHEQRQQQQASSIMGRGDGRGLTPLSCNLFDVLGVSKETVIQVARLLKGKFWASVFARVVTAYTRVLDVQVGMLCSLTM